MACCCKYNYFFLHSHFLWRRVPFPRCRVTGTVTTSSYSRNFQSPKLLSSSRAPLSKGYCTETLDSRGDGVVSASSQSNATLAPEISYGAAPPVQLGSVRNAEDAANSDSFNGRVMLIDGTSVIHRAYYKLLAKLHHGHLTHADGNGDWVLTIFSALSFIVDVLEFILSHVVVVFDHDGIPFRHTCNSSKESFTAKGQNFRHNLYPSYKSNRPPTPDTIVQGLQYLKASIKAMCIKVIEVPGVEADDVIGTLALRRVDDGYKLLPLFPSIPQHPAVQQQQQPAAAASKQPAAPISFRHSGYNSSQYQLLLRETTVHPFPTLASFGNISTPFYDCRVVKIVVYVKIV